MTEDLTGTKDGVNVTFTISTTPNIGSLQVFFNTSSLYRKTSGPGPTQYSVTGTTITLGLAPQASDNIWAQYESA